MAVDSSEWSWFFRMDELRGVSAMHAHFVEHRYPRHTHEYAVISLIEAGTRSCFYRGERQHTGGGEVCIVNAEEPHTGEPVDESGYTCLALYLEPSFFAAMLPELNTARQRPFLHGGSHRDVSLANSLARFHRALVAGAPALDRESSLFEGVTQLFDRYGATPWPRPPSGEEPVAVSRAREYLEAYFDQDVSLVKLAEAVRLSPYHLARTFEKTTGMPPHTCLEGIRIRRACEMLDRGESIAGAALSVGYADQSHLTKRFKRVLGITPMQYINGGSRYRVAVWRRRVGESVVVGRPQS